MPRPALTYGRGAFNSQTISRMIHVKQIGARGRFT